MIIGIDASKIYDSQRTGIGNTAFNIAKELQNFDKLNTYYLFNNKKQTKNKLFKNKNFCEKNIPFSRFWSSFRLPLALLNNKVDVFLEFTNYLPATAPKKSIILIHDIAFKFFPEVYSKKDLYLLEKTSKTAITKAKKIIFSSKANLKDFKKFYQVSDNKLEVIPLACGERFFTTKKDKSKLPKILKNNPYFLFVGRIENKKNVLNIVKAFYKIRQNNPKRYTLVLAGKDGLGSKEIEEAINHNKSYKQDIIKMGYVSDDALPYLYRNAEAFIFPSLYEGFGIPILEAMASKIPVITSDVSTIKEIASDAALYVDPKNHEKITEAMNTIINDKNLKDSLIKKGYANAKKYSWKKTAKMYYELINNL